jgi:hypothetical protein
MVDCCVSVVFVGGSACGCKGIDWGVVEEGVVEEGVVEEGVVEEDDISFERLPHDAHHCQKGVCLGRLLNLC